MCRICVSVTPPTLECGCRHLNVLLWAPGPQKVQKRKNFSRHPGGELTSSCRCSVPTLSTNHIQGPTGPSRALRFLRLSIFSSNQGPVWALKTRALYKDQSQRAQHLVTDNVPTLTVSSHNVPTLVMFEQIKNRQTCTTNMMHVCKKKNTS